MDSGPVIRLATPNDVPTILAFMHQTAVDQGVSSSVTATHADLLSSIDFGVVDAPHSGTVPAAPRNAKVLVVVAPEGNLAGMATYFNTFAAWLAKPGICLEDIYVVPEYRRRGYARLLVQAVAKEADRLGCMRVEWLCFKENHRALSFYKSLGAKEMETMAWLRLDKDALEKLIHEPPRNDESSER